MASGCVVIVGKGCFSKGLITDGVNGIVAESADVIDIAKSMLRALSDEKLAARLTSKARKTVEEAYDWEVIVSELEDRLRYAAELRI